MQQFTEMFNMLCNREARFNGTNWGETNSQIEGDVHALAIAAAKLISNDKCAELVECLKDRMEAPDVQKRLLAFWLLDRTCQEVYNAPSHQVDSFIKTIEKQLYGLLRLITGGAEQPGIKQVCFSGVHSILKSWTQKRLLKPAIIANAIKQISGCMQTETKKDGHRPNYYSGISVGAGNYDKQQIERMHQDTIPHEEEQRQEGESRRLTEKEKQARDLMEQQRSSQKREKLEKALRPINEAEDGEFSELWAKTIRQEQDRERFANAEEDFWARWKRGSPIWRPEFPKGPNGKLLYGHSVEDDGDDVMTVPQGSPQEKSRRRKRSMKEEDKPERRYDNEVWVWELDALTGERLLWNMDGDGPELGNKLKAEMFDMADRLFFCQELDAEQPFHILEQQRFDDNRDLNGYDFANDGGVQRKGPLYPTLLAYRYRRIQQLYDHGLHRLLSDAEMNKVNTLFEEFKRILRKGEKSSCEGVGGPLSQRRSWIEVALSCIQRIKQGGGRNVVICSAPLIASLAKCQLSGLGAEFPAYTIYSGDSPSSIAKCFDDIVQRWGRDCDYHVVYDNEGQANDTWRELPKVVSGCNAHFAQITAVEDVQGLFRCLNAPKRSRPLPTNVHSANLPAGSMWGMSLPQGTHGLPAVLPSNTSVNGSASSANGVSNSMMGHSIVPQFSAGQANTAGAVGNVIPATIPSNLVGTDAGPQGPLPNLPTLPAGFLPNSGPVNFLQSTGQPGAFAMANWMGQQSPLAPTFLPFNNPMYDPRLVLPQAPTFFQVPFYPQQSFLPPLPSPPSTYFVPTPQYRAP